jgi:hypothetical protein
LGELSSLDAYPPYHGGVLSILVDMVASPVAHLEHLQAVLYDSMYYTLYSVNTVLAAASPQRHSLTDSLTRERTSAMPEQTVSQQHIAIMESPLPRSTRFIPMIPRSEAYVPC